MTGTLCVTKRVLWMIVTMGMLVYLVDLAFRQNLSTMAAMAVIILAADQIHTHITYRDIKERMSMMFPMILVAAIYLPPSSAALASTLGLSGALCLQWVFENMVFHKVVVNLLATLAASLVMILVFNTAATVLHGSWPSVASAIAAIAAGLSFELTSYSVLALAWMVVGGKTFMDTARIWAETWWYSLFGIASALAIALTTERNMWVFLALVGVLLAALKPSYELRHRAPRFTAPPAQSA